MTFQALMIKDSNDGIGASVAPDKVTDLPDRADAQVAALMEVGPMAKANDDA